MDDSHSNVRILVTGGEMKNSPSYRVIEKLNHLLVVIIQLLRRSMASISICKREHIWLDSS